MGLTLNDRGTLGAVPCFTRLVLSGALVCVYYFISAFVKMLLSDASGSPSHHPLWGFFQLGVLLSGMFVPRLVSSPPEKQRSRWEGLHVWMATSLMVCVAGLMCRFLNGRMDPITLGYHQVIVPTAVLLVWFVAGIARREAWNEYS